MSALTCTACDHGAHNGPCLRMVEQIDKRNNITIEECACPQFMPDWEELQALICEGER